MKEKMEGSLILNSITRKLNPCNCKILWIKFLKNLVVLQVGFDFQFYNTSLYIFSYKIEFNYFLLFKFLKDKTNKTIE